jgi:16S rRNA processing protein RimM
MDATSNSTSSTTPSSGRLAVARILGVKGLRGGLRVETLTDFPERLAPKAEVWLDGATEPSTIARVEAGGRTLVLYLAGVETRETADAIIGRYLEMPPHALPDGAYYWDDLVGLEVRDPRGDVVGELVEVFRAGENEVYRIVGPGGERLIPALRSVVLDIDLAAGRMTVADDDALEVR